MLVKSCIFILGLTLSLTIHNALTLGIRANESSTENATGNRTVVFPSTTENSFPVTDNGMTLGEIPDTLTADNTIDNFLVNDVHDLGNMTTHSSVYIESVREAPKNFTASPYVGAIELPPLLEPYRQRTQALYEHNSKYNRKPIKFDSGLSQYETHGKRPYLEDDYSQEEETQHIREPFPYIYETERLPFLSQTQWSALGGLQQKESETFNHYSFKEPSGAYGQNLKKEEHKVTDSWKKVFSFFTALVPLGFLLATLTPNVISINSTTYQNPLKQRSIQGRGLNLLGDDLKDQLKKKYGSNGTKCDNELICKMSRMGKENWGTFMQKQLWKLANETPDGVAEEMGLKELFQAIRLGNCGMYKCMKTLNGR